MTLPVRKPMRLKAFDYSADGAYFITICAKDKQKIFGRIVGKDACAVSQLSVCGAIVKRYLVSVPGLDQYVIMPNHIHAIIIISSKSTHIPPGSSPKQTIAQRIKSFKTLVTKAAGASVFQRSYYDHVIRNDEDYRQILDYINTNPNQWADNKWFVA